MSKFQPDPKILDDAQRVSWIEFPENTKQLFAPSSDESTHPQHFVYGIENVIHKGERISAGTALITVGDSPSEEIIAIEELSSTKQDEVLLKTSVMNEFLIGSMITAAAKNGGSMTFYKVQKNDVESLHGPGYVSTPKRSLKKSYS